MWANTCPVTVSVLCWCVSAVCSRTWEHTCQFSDLLIVSFFSCHLLTTNCLNVHRWRSVFVLDAALLLWAEIFMWPALKQLRRRGFSFFFCLQRSKYKENEVLRLKCCSTLVAQPAGLFQLSGREMGYTMDGLKQRDARPFMLSTVSS